MHVIHIRFLFFVFMIINVNSFLIRLHFIIHFLTNTFFVCANYCHVDVKEQREIAWLAKEKGKLQNEFEAIDLELQKHQDHEDRIQGMVP